MQKKNNIQNIIINGEAVKPSCYSTNRTVRQLQEKKFVKHTIQNLYCLFIIKREI